MSNRGWPETTFGAQRRLLSSDVVGLVHLVVLAMLAVATWSLSRAISNFRKRRPADHRVRRWVGVVVRGAAVAVLVYLPMLVAGWRGGWTWAPDVTLVLATLTALLAATTVVRLLALVVGPRRIPSHDFTEELGGQHVHA